MIKIYLTNLAEYNEGRLVGMWVELPLTEKELELAIQSVLGDDEECFITDYEADFHIERYADIQKINAFAEKFESLDPCDQEKVAFLLGECGYNSREKALDEIDNIVFYEGTMKYENNRR